MVSLHSAFHDATPLVMLVGQVERKDFGRQALQEQNYSKMLSDINEMRDRSERAEAGLGSHRPSVPPRGYPACRDRSR